MKRFAAVLLTAILLAPMTSEADMRLSYSTPDGAIPFKVQVAGNKIRVDNNGAYGHTYSIIDLDAGTVHTVLPQHRMVTVIDGRTSGRLNALLEQSKAARERMLNMLPPDYAMTLDLTLKGIKGILRMYVDQITPDVVSVDPTGETREIVGVTCEVWETTADQSLWTTSCLAAPEDLGVERIDVDRMNAAFLLNTVLAQEISAQSPAGTLVSIKMQDVEGVAVEMDQKLHGLGLWTLTEISTDPVTADSFEIPSGYKMLTP